LVPCGTITYTVTAQLPTVHENQRNFFYEMIWWI
jgi:hypothetical protein